MKIKAKHTIIFEAKGNLPQKDKVSLAVTISKNLKTRVDLNFRNKKITVLINNYPLSKATINYFSKSTSSKLEELSLDVKNEITNIHSALTKSTIRVLSLIKYHLSYIDISEQLFSIKSRQWSLDGQNWKALPSTLSCSIDSYSTPNFDKQICEKLQESLNKNIIPLIGMRYLHRAKKENLPHHKWINATIAAELAVKEVLIRAKPDLETLLTEVPSPPLPKLYGPILKAYLGEPSPYLNIIRKGIEKRNALIHRPNAEKIDNQAAINYVNNIEKVIFHLLSLLYPEDYFIKQKIRI